MEFKDVIRNRFSCKKYSDRPVEDGKLTAKAGDGSSLLF